MLKRDPDTSVLSLLSLPPRCAVGGPELRLHPTDPHVLDPVDYRKPLTGLPLLLVLESHAWMHANF